MTKSSTITYTLTFAGPVTGLTAGDLRRTGTAMKCKIGTPTGGPTQYVIRVTNCTHGWVYLRLNQDTVIGASSAVGPLGPILAAKVKIKR